MKIIAPSILACDFLNLEKDIKKINDSKAQWIHFDVMDGHFVKNLTFGPDIFKYFKANSNLFLDVHLMVSNPKFIGDLFIESGANQIVFHYEALANDQKVLDLINHIKQQNVKVGLALKPNTSINLIKEFLPLLDLVLVMSVEPGFGNQKFMHESLDKVEKLNQLRTTNNYQYLIQIDGGINNHNKDQAYLAGVDCLVAGSYLFKQADFSLAVESLL